MSALDSPVQVNKPLPSCVRCAERKVRCDRRKPCSNCVKHNAECVTQQFKPPRKKQKKLRGIALNEQLKHYETLLQEHGIDPRTTSTVSESNVPQTSEKSETSPSEVTMPLPSRSSTASEPETPITRTQLLHYPGRSKLVDNILWTRVVEEFRDDDDDDGLDDSSIEDDETEASEDPFDFLLGISPRSQHHLHHPPAEHIHELWQIYVENIDPLTKIVHVPTLQPAIQKAATETSNIPRGFEALMFAIYVAAVMSLKDAECRQRFGEARRTLLSRYISAAKMALLRAKFMGTSSLGVLQALLLFLISVRDIYEPRSVWTLTGVAIRIGERMGLSTDGATLGLPPFESEMRRRIWWQLRAHDWRSAELSGMPKFIGLETDVKKVKRSANVDDDELYPGMPELEDREVTRATDSIYCVLRTEFGVFAAKTMSKIRLEQMDNRLWDDVFNFDANGMDEAARDVEKLIETRYLRYCDPSEPLQLLTMLTARSATNNMRFIANHPRRWVVEKEVSQAKRQYVWGIATKQLQQFNMMQSHPQLQRFAWQQAYYIPWYAVIHILDTLRADPLMNDPTKPWELVQEVYQNNPILISDTKRPIHVAVGTLCLKAYTARDIALQNLNMPQETPPEYIKKLLELREIANARKEQATQKRGSKSASPYDMTSIAAVAPFTEDTGLDGLIRPHDPYQTQPATGGPGYSNQNDNFWSNIGFFNDSHEVASGAMELDTDFMLTQDLSLGDNGSSTIDWTQWDAWINQPYTGLDTSPGDMFIQQRS